MVLEHMKLQDKEALGLSNEDNFKERTQLSAVNHTYRDSDGKYKNIFYQQVLLITLIKNSHIDVTYRY